MENEKRETLKGGGKDVMVGMEDIGEDLMRNILRRLPALSFASAACVSRSWNSLCNQLLSSPKLSSAVSFTSDLNKAVSEVVDKVLSEPIRPHFALASVRPSFSLKQAHQLIAEKLGSTIPIIINVSEGIIGRDHLSDKFVEVQWEVTGGEEFQEEANGAPRVTLKPGIILTVGFLPGLKAHIVPLFEDTGSQGLQVDKFVMDIRGYVSALSDSESPAGILLYSDKETDIKPVLQMMEFAFSPETVIVGDGGSQFLYSSDEINTTVRMSRPQTAVVALLFARDKNKPSGIGETKFHVMLSTGISPVGVTYKVSAVKCYPTSTFLTGSRETLHEYLDGQTMLEEIYDELGDRIQYHSFYIGVTKRRKCSVGMEKVRRMQFLEFHEVQGGNEEYLFVDSAGIRTGDPFQFYISNSKAAISNCKKVADDLRHLKQEWECSHDYVTGGSACKREVFGGIVFTCCGRGDPFFGQPRIDSSPFFENFPGVPFGGTYCAGEIGRGNSRLYNKDKKEGSSIHCLQHVYSAVYLVMSYCPPPPQH